MTTMRRRGVVDVEANIVLKIGASATIGIAATAAAIGESSCSKNGVRGGEHRQRDAEHRADQQPDQRVRAAVEECRPDVAREPPHLLARSRSASAARTARCPADDDEQLPQQQRAAPDHERRGASVARHRAASALIAISTPRACDRRRAGRAAPHAPAVTLVKNAASSRSVLGPPSPEARRPRSRVIRPGPRRHHDDPVGQEHRLGDGVGHEHDGRAGLPADPHELDLHPLAGHLVERTERLVHQQQPRALGEGAGDRDALLHAAGELVGSVRRRSRPARPARAAPRPAPGAAPCPTPCSSSGSSMFAAHRAPGQQAGLLERDAVVLVRAVPASGLAEDLDRARGRLVEVGHEPQQRALAAAATARSARRTHRARRRGRRPSQRRPPCGRVARRRPCSTPATATALACWCSVTCGPRAHRSPPPVGSGAVPTSRKPTSPAATSPRTTAPKIGAHGLAGSPLAAWAYSMISRPIPPRVRSTPRRRSRR